MGRTMPLRAYPQKALDSRKARRKRKEARRPSANGSLNPLRPRLKLRRHPARWISRTWLPRKGGIRGHALGTCKNKRAVAKAPGRQCADHRVVVHPPTGYDNVRQGALHDHDHAPAGAPALQLSFETIAPYPNTACQVSAGFALNDRAAW